MPSPPTSITVDASICDDNGQRICLSYAWLPTDAGRSASKRPRQVNDCTVRALAIACGFSYDQAYDTLKLAGRKCRAGFKLSNWLNQQQWAEKISFPATKGMRRMNPSTFTAQFPDGHYIVKVAHHVFACVNGVIHDIDRNPPDRCIYTAWRIKR